MSHSHELDSHVKLIKETEEVLVMILFDVSLTKAFCNTIIKEKNIIRNYGNGQMVGYSEEVKVMEGDWSQKYTMGLLRFDTLNDARKWNFSDPLTKQHDWLDQVEMYVIPLARPFPKKEYQVMELFNCDILNKQAFYEHYWNDYCSSISNSGCEGLLTCTDQIEKWRGRHNFCNITISIWPTIDAYMTWRESAEYDQIKGLKDEICVGETVLVELKTKV